MKKLTLLGLSIIVVLAVSVISPALALGEGAPEAGPIATAGVIGYSVQSDGDDHLYSIDLNTGAATSIGPVGFADVEGLSFDAHGVLYGVDDITEQLITIDLTTGAGMAIGPLNASIVDMGLTFDPFGNLWMSTDLPGDFYSINPATGAATTIGPQGQMVTGLASSADGTIYGIGGDWADNLVTINTATGWATPVGPLLNVTLVDGGIDFDPSGVLWGIEDQGTIFTIDPWTGQGMVVAATLLGFEGLAIPRLPELEYRFQVNPYIDIIHLNTNPDGWLNGYDEVFGSVVGPVLGKYEKGIAYIAVDFTPPGYYTMAFLVIRIATRDGFLIRITDWLELAEPEYVWLTPVTTQSTEGPTIADAVGSSVTPQAWYSFTVNPWVDIYNLCTDLAPWLWGYTDYNGSILGCTRGDRFFLATDFPDGAGGYELSFKAGTISTRDGWSQRTYDGLDYAFDYFWLTPA